MLAVFALVGACTGSAPTAQSPSPGTSPSPATTAGATPSESPSPSPTAGVTPLVATLPDGCPAGTPSAAATIAFVAGARAWAVAPDGAGLTCLFEVTDPGPFVWGPRADRVVLADMEVRPVGVDVSNPPGAVEPASLSWGRPNGIAIVYVDPADPGVLTKLTLENGERIDVTPNDELTYEHVIYHPSGLALAFTAEGPDGSAIWVSSNTGADPQRLLFTVSGTEFGPIAFDQAGTNVYYGARLPGGASIVGVKPMSQEPPNEGLWLGDADVLSVLPGPPGQASTIALDTGTDCDDRTATFGGDGGPGVAALPGASGPTSAVGWLDDRSVLVTEGGCDEPLDLWIAGPTGAAPVLVAHDVARAAARVPEPTPPPALPDIGVEAGFA